ncbi:MAG TPA: hypothetical protein VH372_01045 [Actinospica sp.]|jgi:hypothetical protein|nr:hypothetical protein [Actinospica sp.]
MATARILRFALGGLGAAVFGYGVVGLLTEPAIRDPGAVGEWLVVGLLVHDAVLAPLVFAACAIAYRFTGPRRRGRLAALLLAGGSLVLISVPALDRHGKNANPTVLPLDYARNLGVLLAVLAGASALYGGADALRRRRAAKAEAAARIEEARKMEEARRIEETRKIEEVGKIAEAEKAEEARKIAEASKIQEALKAEEAQEK